MERKIEEEFLRWKEKGPKTALLVKGCRQVGKTYSLLRFARERYRNAIYINFDSEPKYCSLFDDGTDAAAFMENLAYTEFAPLMSPGETIVIFDEVQACPRAFSALKHLVNDGRFDYAASGSLLGVELSDEQLSPMGHLTILDMHPMDFEEFLWAFGVDRARTEGIRRHISEMDPFSEFQLERLREMFLRYVAIGGMPAAVSAFAESRSYADAAKALEDIIAMVRSDSMKHAPRADRLRISACLDSIPEQLGKENNTFSYYDVEQMRGAGRNVYGPSLEWLTGAGVALKVSNVSEPREPLRRNVKERSFKVYMADTGILTLMTGPDIASRIVSGDRSVNNGAVMENAVEAMLHNLGHRTFFFQKSNSTLEIDFLIEYRGEVTALEVKSGRYDYPKSLITVMSDRYGVGKGILLADENIRTDDHGVVHMPLFAPAFFEPAAFAEIPEMDGIERLNEDLKDERES